MDVNQTKFHLLLSRADWGNCLSANGEKLDDFWAAEKDSETPNGQEFSWDEEKNEITLQPQLFKFTGSSKEEKIDLKNRRGAARDRYGNWYWIDETNFKIKVLSTGTNLVSDFYPLAAEDCAKTESGGFAPIETAEQTPFEIRGLAITTDHYLVVGMFAPAGLLIFDLFATGEPRRVLWREDVDFSPFDMAARFDGGVFILDRKNRRYWTLDRRFYVIGESPVESESLLDDFQPLDENAERKRCLDLPADKLFSSLPPFAEPISIESLPDNTVLILNLPQDEDFSTIYRYYRGHLLDELPTSAISAMVKKDEKPVSPPEKFRLRGYDLAYVESDQAAGTWERVFVVTEEGNQAFAFALVCLNQLIISPFPELPPNVVKKHLELQPLAEYYPMRLFGGKGLATSDGKVYFDFGERRLPLIKQNRPSFIESATLETPIFDGKETDCVWHRLMLDGCISPETKIEVKSRSAAEKEDIQSAAWQREPDFYLRGNGSELPFVSQSFSKEKGTGTWELLLQNCKNRYLQLCLSFSGNGQRSPRISALRVYYPRFSYLNHYLPSIYRDDEQSAFFLDRFLANFEGFYTAIEGRIADAQMLFDVRSAPPDALEWLGKWFGIAFHPAWTDAKRRLFISRAMDFYQSRGTARGLRIALRLALDSCADERIFETRTAEEILRDPIRLVERFQTRRTPQIIPPDSIVDKNLPRISGAAAKWSAEQGANALHHLYAAKFENQPNKKFSLIRPADAGEAAIWENFALENLGFAPSDAAATDRQSWQSFLTGKYQNNIYALNAAYGADFQSFTEIFVPRGTETNQTLKADWNEFAEFTTISSRWRKLWQDFLARRYRRVGQLNEVYGTNWNSFESIALFDRLPLTGQPLADWFLYESGVLPMQQTAHRFTVMIPAANGGSDTHEEQARKFDLARRVVEMEKPAHTVCDFRYYWNLFRLDEARLGSDTLLGLGSRDPSLNPDLILGQSFVGESRLGTVQPEKFTSRYVLGNEALKQTKTALTPKKDGEK